MASGHGSCARIGFHVEQHVISWEEGDGGRSPGPVRLCPSRRRAMGADPRKSVLNKWSQAHDASNLYVTDGAQMASVSCVNPSLTFMALTARAADHAVRTKAWA